MNNNILDYQMSCVQKEWEGEKVNRIKIEIIDNDCNHYSFKETIANAYSYEDFLKEKEHKNKESILVSVKKNINSITK